MSSAVGWPLGEAAGLVTVDVDDEVAVAGLSLGIEGAPGELLCSCANDGMTASVEQKRIAKERGVFMGAVFQDATRSQAGLRTDARAIRVYQPRTFAKMSGATMVASDSIMYFGVSTLSLPQVIFSLGTAPEYDPKLVVESLIWQK